MKKLKTKPGVECSALLGIVLFLAGINNSLCENLEVRQAACCLIGADIRSGHNLHKSDALDDKNLQRRCIYNRPKSFEVGDLLRQCCISLVIDNGNFQSKLPEMLSLLDASRPVGGSGRNLASDDDTNNSGSTANNRDKDKNKLIHILLAEMAGFFLAMMGVITGAWLVLRTMPNDTSSDAPNPGRPSKPKKL
jgi:hypothetical protein